MTLQQLPALLPAATVARWHAALQARPGGSLPLCRVLDCCDLLQALSPLRPHIATRLGIAPQIVSSQCWVRRATPPHSWHQDGALHHDFATDSAPLPMWTAWIALTPCGADAPGLAWVLPSLPTLLAPAALVDTAVRSRFGPVETAVLQPGDSLLFDGGLLHCTHLTSAMTQPRTSIELRFIAAGAVPERLRGETLQTWA